MASGSGTSARNPIARVENDDRITVGALLLAMSATVIMLQATRDFLSYMVFIIDQSERAQLGPSSLIVEQSAAPATSRNYLDHEPGVKDWFEYRQRVRRLRGS